MKFGQLQSGEIAIQDSESGLLYPASWWIPGHLLPMMDSATTKFLLHQVTEWEAQFAAYETEGITFPQLGTVQSIASGFNHVAYQQKLRQGAAEFLSRNATNFPVSSFGTVPNISNVIPIGSAYEINFFEQATSQRFGISLDTEGLVDCAELIDTKLEQAWHLGGTNPQGLMVKGMFDYFNGGADAEIAAGTSIYKVALSSGDAGDTHALKTGAEIAVDVARGFSAVRLNSKKNANCNKIELGSQLWATWTEKFIVTDGGANIPLINYLKMTYPGVMFIDNPYLDAITMPTAATPHETWDGAAGSGAILFYSDSPNNFKFLANRREILRPYEGPQGFQQAKVNTYGLTGGIQMRRPYAFAYMKGVR